MIGLVLEGVKTVFGWMKEKSKAKHEKNMAVLELEKRLLLSRQQANSQWELAQLKNKDKIMRWCAFLLFASPLIAYWISPSFGKEVQAGWSFIEPWQAEVLKSMCLAVFGYRACGKLVGSITGNIAQSLKK